MLTVAIIDGDAESRYLVTLVLEERFKVNAFSRASEALTGLRICQPDVLLIALTLPDMDGFELLSRLRREPALKGLPVVAVADCDLARDPRIRGAGFNRVVRKPIRDERALLEMVMGLAQRVTQTLSLPHGYRLEDLAS